MMEIPGRLKARPFTSPFDLTKFKAMSLLGESLAISNELGMRLLMARVLSRLNTLEALLKPS